MKEVYNICGKKIQERNFLRHVDVNGKLTLKRFEECAVKV
jgi:hypothetical protein